MEPRRRNLLGIVFTALVVVVAVWLIIRIVEAIWLPLVIIASVIIGLLVAGWIVYRRTRRW